MGLRLLHTAENHGPTMFHMATVSHKRWDPCLLYCTSLISLNILHGQYYQKGAIVIFSLEMHDIGKIYHEEYVKVNIYSK